MIRAAAPGRLSAMGALLAYGYDIFAGEFIKGLARLFDLPRQPQVQWGWTLADSRGGVVDGAMARAKPAAERAAVVAGLLTERNAAEMRAHADDDQPFGFPNAVRILLRITQLRDVDVFCRLDLLGCAMSDKDRLAAPRDGQTLTDLDRCEVNLGSRKRQCVARRVQGVDERPNRRDDTDAADRSGRQQQEVAPCFTWMRFATVLLRDVGHSQTSYSGGLYPAAHRRPKLYR